MAENCYLAEIVLFEDKHGAPAMEHKCRILVHPDSSSRTVEGLDSHIRALFGVGTGVHLRITREQWDTAKREAQFTAGGDLTHKRRFVVRFTGSGKMPQWSETDW